MFVPTKAKPKPRTADMPSEAQPNTALVESPLGLKGGTKGKVSCDEAALSKNAQMTGTLR